MLELSEGAKKELEAYFEGKEKATIRVYLAPGGCSGPRLALGIDEPVDGDIVEEQGGFKFCINDKLAEEVGSVKIDLNPMGFVVEPEKPLPQPEGGPACGSCCGGCGSH